MNAQSIRCSKCNGLMIQGWISDLVGDDRHRVSNWIEGVSRKPNWFSRFFGTGVPALAEKHIAVGNFRCSVCGFLESFAHPEFTAR